MTSWWRVVFVLLMVHTCVVTPCRISHADDMSGSSCAEPSAESPVSIINMRVSIPKVDENRLRGKNPKEVTELMLRDWQEGKLRDLYAFQEEEFRVKCSYPTFAGHMIIVCHNGQSVSLAHPEEFRVLRVEYAGSKSAKVYWEGVLRPLTAMATDEGDITGWPWAIRIPSTKPNKVCYENLVVYLQSPLSLVLQEGIWHIRGLFEFDPSLHMKQRDDSILTIEAGMDYDKHGR